tara:strand:+ start:450 stop:899 length:450 start_codon:yes stop_codon:yes gene_type:complete
MSFLVAMQVMSTGLAISSALSKGNAEATAYEMDAREQENRIANEKIIAQQRHNDRVDEFSSSQKVNEAYFAFLGRDVSDRSFIAFEKKNKETAYSDLRRSNFQSLIEIGQMRSQAEQDRFSGRMARKRSRTEAMMAAVSGFSNISKTSV